MEIDRLSKLPEPIIYLILSLMETKYAVRTSLLSKQWRFYWTFAHNLNFDYSSTDKNFLGFINFVTDVMERRMPLDLKSARFHSALLSKCLIREVSNYAISECNAKEFDTNATISFPPCLDVQCETILRTLKLGPCRIQKYCEEPGSRFKRLTTLQLYKVEFDNYEDAFDLFPNFPNLESLFFIDCRVREQNKLSFKISAPRLTCLTISNFKVCDTMRLEISAPVLKFFNLNGNPMMLSMENCQNVEEMNIGLVQPIEDGRNKILKEAYIFNLIHMTKGLCHPNSLRVLFSFFTKGRFLLSCDWNSDVTEIKFVGEHMETEKEWLPVILCMVRVLGLDELALEFEKSFEEDGWYLSPIVFQSNI